MAALACPAPDLSAVLDGTDDRLARWFLARKAGVRRRAADYPDALQICRLALIRAAKAFRPAAGAAWLTWAYRTMRNAFVNWHNVERRGGLCRCGDLRINKAARTLPRRADGADRLRAFESLPARDPAPDAVAEAGELWANLRHLSERRRLAILYRFRDGLTLGEVGDRLGMTHERARQIVDDALIKLRRILSAQR